MIFEQMASEDHADQIPPQAALPGNVFQRWERVLSKLFLIAAGRKLIILCLVVCSVSSSFFNQFSVSVSFLRGE